MIRGTERKNHALRRIAAIALLLILATALTLTVVTGVYYSNFTKDSYTASARNFSVALNDTLKNTDLSEYIAKDSVEEDDNVLYYNAVREYLRGLCDLAGAKYTYLFNTVNENDMRFIMTIASDDEEDKKVKQERRLGVVVTIPENDRSNIKRASEGEFIGPQPVNNQYGNVLIYYFPIYYDDEIVCVAGIDYDVSAVSRTAVRNVVGIVLVVTVVLIAVLGVLLLVLRKKVFEPIKSISVQMNSFDPEGEQERLSIRSYHEINEISSSFNKLTDDIIGYISNLKVMTEERAHTAAELGIARSIQTGMVPRESRLSGEGYEVYACAKPAKEVGGDFYSIFEMNGEVFLVIADVSGKGVAAALFMSMAMNMIKGKLRSGLSPADALNSANDELCAENPEGMFVTVFAAVLDPHTGQLIFANAGHTRPLISGSEGKRFLEPAPGIALGLFEDADIINEKMDLSEGQCLTAYTDGITEAVSGGREFFGEQRLLEAAQSGSAEDTAEAIVGAVSRFSKGCEQSDDITLLTLRFNFEGELYRETLPCQMSSLGIMRDKLLELAADSPKKRKIALACEEIIVNIIEYSGSESIGVTLARKGQTLAVCLEDSGKAFDPLSEQPGEKDFEDYDTGGMGIRMVMQIAESVRYIRVSGKNVITMLFGLNDK